MNTEKKVRVRFAPSPTGGLHMGGVRTALFNYLFAKKHGGDFILRIEDTDQNRYVKGAEEYIIESLKWCGIEPNEGVGFGDGPHAPYRQSERKKTGIYEKYAQKLIEAGGAYYAFDTEEELEEMRKRLEVARVVSPQYNHITRMNMRNSLTLSYDEVQKLLDSGVPYVVRLKVPRNEEIRFYDIIRGWIVVNSSTIDDKVLLKSDGMPTYHLAHIVDDIEMQITHVIRGEEWLPSAPAHVLTYKFLGLEQNMPQLAHLPLILKPDGKGKLSKRDTSGLPMFPLNWYDERTGESYVGYKESGFFPEAFINMLALLGWNPGNNQEILSKQELIQLFSLEKVHKAGAKFDPEKTKWFNQQYLRKKDKYELADLLQPILKENNIQAEKNYVAEVCELMKEKAYFVKDIWDMGSYMFVDPDTYDEKVIQKKWNTESQKIIIELLQYLDKTEPFSAEHIHHTFEQFIQQKHKIDYQLLRTCITGVSSGPSLAHIMAVLGKEKVKDRILKVLERVKV
ncbi:MAG: glutamate--tRNA ligase [Bacteroidia bacterium]|nr:glutamate--tRNA ligase [Bacteroidia bacterium]